MNEAENENYGKGVKLRKITISSEISSSLQYHLYRLINRSFIYITTGINHFLSQIYNNNCLAYYFFFYLKKKLNWGGSGSFPNILLILFKLFSLSSN
jgi:hypothetical protein